MSLHDLLKAAGELANLRHPDHPDHYLALVEQLLRKPHPLVRDEIGDDRAPFDLNLVIVQLPSMRGRSRACYGASDPVQLRHD